jgi:hypothetical protein
VLGTPQRLGRGRHAAAARERLAHAEITGRERIGFRQRAHRQVLSRPVADAGQRREPRDRSVEVTQARQVERPLGDHGREPAQRLGPRPWHGVAGERQRRDRGRGREHVRERAARLGERPSRREHEAAGERAGGRDRDLLSEQRAHREFERVPCARHAHRARAQRAGEQRVAGQVFADRQHVRIEVEQARHFRDHARQLAGDRGIERQPHAAVAVGRHLEHRVLSVQHHRAPIDTACHFLDAGNRPARQEREHWRGVERSARRYAQCERAIPSAG